MHAAAPAQVNHCLTRDLGSEKRTRRSCSIWRNSPGVKLGSVPWVQQTTNLPAMAKRRSCPRGNLRRALTVASVAYQVFATESARALAAELGAASVSYGILEWALVWVSLSESDRQSGSMLPWQLA